MESIFKNYLLVILTFLIWGLPINGQSLFKGLKLGMTKKEARKEYKANKDDYTNVDIGKGWIYTTTIPNMYFDNNKGLVRIYFYPKGALLSGIGHQNTMNGLEMTKQFFENIGYEVFYKNENWKYPLNFANNYALLMTDSEKTKVVHLFPTHPPGNPKEHTIGLILIEHDLFMEAYNKGKEELKKKQKKSGFR